MGRFMGPGVWIKLTAHGGRWASAVGPWCRSTPQSFARRMLDFVIIGAQKSGSTFIQERVGAHPEAYTPYGETPYFQDPDYNADGFEALVAELKTSAGDRKIGIKRPNYLACPEVPARIRTHAPNVRLIAVLRDPRERAVSAYYHLMRSRMIPISEIEAGLPRILDGELLQRWPASQTLLDYGLYGKHLQDWLGVFPSEQILVQFYQDIKTDQATLSRQAFEHLGLDPAFLDFPTRRRPMEGIYSLTRQRWNAAAVAIGYQLYDGGRRTRPRSNYAARAAWLAMSGIDRVLWSRLFKARAPKLSPSLWSRLTDYYADDTCLLEELTGRDLSAWRD